MGLKLFINKVINPVQPGLEEDPDSNFGFCWEVTGITETAGRLAVI